MRIVWRVRLAACVAVADGTLAAAGECGDGLRLIAIMTSVALHPLI